MAELCRIFCRALMIAGLASMLPLSAVSADPPLGPVSTKAEVSARTIATLLHNAKPGERPDLSGKFLAYLDLADLDFKGANLARSDLYGADFTGANLSGADLSYTRLDRSILIRANFSGANLTGATVYRPTIYSDLKNETAEAPRFSGANLSRIRVQAELSGSDFRGADLTEASFSPREERPGEGTMATTYRNVLKYCDFSKARLRGAHMQRTIMWFAKFEGADLRGADFTDADLSHANFGGADISGASFMRANLDGANFVGTEGVNDAKGFDQAINFDRALH